MILISDQSIAEVMKGKNKFKPKRRKHRKSS